MEKYNVIDLQEKPSITVSEMKTKKDVRSYAYGLIEDRVANAHEAEDEFAKELSITLKRGFEKFTFQEAVQTLDIWGYGVQKISV